MEAVDSVVDFLLRERYLLSAFELLHELLENGMADSQAAGRLNQFFADLHMFPADQLLHVQSLQEADVQKLVEEKTTAAERAAVLEYELRLAQEDVKALRMKLEETVAKADEIAGTDHLDASSSKINRMGTHERKDLNRAVKDYLVSAGYKLTAMTFCEEVVDQDLDDCSGFQNALHKYYRAYLSHEGGHSEAMQNDEALLEMKNAFETEKNNLKHALDEAQAHAARSEMMVHELQVNLKQVSDDLDATKAELVALKLQQEENQNCQQTDASYFDSEKVITTVESTSEDRKELQQSTEMTSQQIPVELQIPPESVQRNLTETAEQPFEEPSTRSTQKEDPDTVHILADALPKIVPYVLINHREELLPLIICAIGRHPDSGVRDSLTHILFNLIKRPDEAQRRIIMDACISLSMTIGDVRTENELLPQCWEQINHNYEERRLLVAQSCGELGRFVRSDMRSSLILSILEQLIEDPAAIVREAASYNLAHLLPLFPNMDKYTKVEKVMFHLLSDPSGEVIEMTLKELVPAVINWGRSAKHTFKQLLQNLLNRMLNIVQRCPPMSGVETSSESQLRALGEKERWNVEVLIRLLTQLLPDVRQACVNSSPFITGEQTSEPDHETLFSQERLEQLLQTNERWDYFDWIVMDCFPGLLKLLSMLPSKEELLRKSFCQLLVSFSKSFGGPCHKVVVRPIFLAAVGDDSELLHFAPHIASRIKTLKPQSPTAQTLALKCVLPLLLAGVFGAGDKQDADLSSFLENLILDCSLKHGLWNCVDTSELVEAIRFFCSYERHHELMVNILWKLVVNPNASVKVHAALLLKELVPYATTNLVSQQLLPALVTLGSDTNLEVRHTSIPAFGVIAQHFRDETVTEKIRVQMDAFLDDGSNEAIIIVVKTLTVAVPLCAPELRDYLLQKLVLLTANSTGTNLNRRREKADVFCEAIRSLDGADLSPTSVRELLLPTIQNLIRDPEVLDPAHKEALEVILRDRSGGRFEAITKAVGALNVSSVSMTSIFGESIPEAWSPKVQTQEPQEQQQVQQQQDGNVLRRMMRTNFSDMIRGRG